MYKSRAFKTKPVNKIEKPGTETANIHNHKFDLSNNYYYIGQYKLVKYNFLFSTDIWEAWYIH